MKLEKNAKALLIFEIFKDQTASAVNKLLRKKDIVVIHVPNNHTNLSQPLDISVNKSPKCYLSSRYQDWYAEKVLKKVDTHLSRIKPLHAKWIADMFKFMKESKDLIISRFRKAHISKAAAESASLINLCENPFQEIELVADTAL